MLATAGTVENITDDGAWRFEGKWDGIRALATLGPNGLRLHSRAGNDFTHAYPELQELTELLDGHSGVLDGEIVALDPKGRTSFSLLQQRMNLAAAGMSRRVRQKVPVQFWLFDVLHLDGVSLLRKRYDDRRRILEALPLSGDVCHVPDQLTGSVREALQGSVDLDWEGIVAKRADSTYLPGKRSRSWIKIKNFRDVEVVIVGWKPGAGRREGSVGSLLLAVPDGDGGLTLRGQGRHRLHRHHPRSADGGPGTVADQDFCRRRHGAEGRGARRGVGASRRWSARSSTSSGRPTAGCARPAGGDSARTSRSPTCKPPDRRPT